MLNLPAAMEPYRPILERGVRPLVALHPTLKPAAAPRDLLRSKLGGAIFWPRDLEYPAVAGARLFPLAQLNLAQLPPLPWLPAAGLLQVFVDDDSGVSVAYHPPAALRGPAAADPAAIAPDYEYFDREIWLEGTLHETAVPPRSYDWELLLGEPAGAWFQRFGAEAGRMWSEYEHSCVVAPDHHLGGYSAVERADHDGRRGEPDAARWRLLLAIDGDAAIFDALFGTNAVYVAADAQDRLDFSQAWVNIESRH